ncbi:MAG: hypothetical protein RMK01_02045 [Thermomicrobium sp.]|nr:hypothetical protein [Thermomicrobium sp.]
MQQHHHDHRQHDHDARAAVGVPPYRHETLHAAAAPAHAGHDPGLLRCRFWISLAATVPVVLLESLLHDLLGLPAVPGADIVVLVLSLFVFTAGGIVFPREPATNCVLAVRG